jgi:uncharacterized repeat protein (TIGR04138 family)
MLLRLTQQDLRYPIEAYLFVREALAYASDQFQLQQPCEESGSSGTATQRRTKSQHLTGQQLCEGIRLYAIMQFGFMAKVVLNYWGIYSTSDFGNIVFNMIRMKILKKSTKDRRSHFDGVYEFDDVFESQFEFSGGISKGRPI